MFEAILACEEAFGALIDAEADVTVEALRTVGSLADLIRAMQGAAGGADVQRPR